jgi:hypothetical protein
MVTEQAGTLLRYLRNRAGGNRAGGDSVRNRFRLKALQNMPYPR